MNQAIIGIGSNIEPKRHVAQALEAIAACFRVLGQSPLVHTHPVGRLGQPDFLNGAIRVETALDRDHLKAWLGELENRLGRVRTADKFAPRIIDLDIVVWNGQVVDPDVYDRNFLRQAVRELWPEALQRNM